MKQLTPVTKAVKPEPKSWSDYSRGLGKHIWQNVDIDEYIKQLRQEWKSKMSLKATLATIKVRVVAAADKAGRDAKEIRLLVAGKYADVAQLEELIRSGQRLIGENRAQNLVRKYARIGDQAEWHFIGHLQRNKAKQIVPIISMLHSLDSTRLADELEKQLAKINQTLPVLIEVNFGEATKAGVAPAELPSLVNYCRKLPHLKLVGLMTMNQATYFKALTQLAQKYYLPELSMGTSSDFEAAIAAGATIIRLGRIVFS